MNTLGSVIPCYSWASALVLFLWVNGGEAINPNHPNYGTLVECSRTRSQWPENGEAMADCMKTLLLTVGPRYRAGQGIPQLKIEPEDPLRIKHSKFAVPGLNMNGNFSNLVVRGLANSLTERNVNVRAMPSEKRAEVSYRIPKMVVDGGIKVSVDFLRVLFPGAAVGGPTVMDGRLHAEFDDVDSTMLLLLARSKDPKRGMEITNAGLSQKYGSISFEMAAVDPSQEALFNMMNSVARTPHVRDELVKQVEPIISRFVTKMKFRLLSQGFDKIDVL